MRPVRFLPAVSAAPRRLLGGLLRSTPLAALALSAGLLLPAGRALAEGGQMPDLGAGPFAQSVAAAAAGDDAVAEWYRATGYADLWTGADDAERRAALLSAVAAAHDHGLPVAAYDATALRAAFAAAETEGDRGRLEVRMTRAYLDWARHLTSGVLDPRKVDPGIVRDIAVIPPQDHLRAIAGDDPAQVMADLLPRSPVYAQLMRARIELEQVAARDGWGAPVPASSLSSGASGAAVVALRDRLIAMGYLPRSSSATYDKAMERAVSAFQLAHGLLITGEANNATMAEINTAPEERLKAVLVAMERERWLDIDRSVRHIWVNQPDFTARVVDHGRTVFQTRVVIGKNVPDQRSPEFSDVMEYMVINPSWSVPRSITVKEYLPLLQRNRNAVGHLQVIDGNGRVVPRGAVNFAAYSAKSFPFALRQPPSDGNALGKVKFMFPNEYNIYLHDTPSKSLFSHEVRAYSHGCIRVADPFDLAHVLLSAQSQAAEEEFDRHLQTGQETSVRFETEIPVHLVYFTAYPDSRGKMGYRRDIYGRDALLFDALTEAGVALAGVQG